MGILKKCHSYLNTSLMWMQKAAKLPYVFDGDAESGKNTVRLWWGCWKRQIYLTSLMRMMKVSKLTYVFDGMLKAAKSPYVFDEDAESVEVNIRLWWGCRKCHSYLNTSLMWMQKAAKLPYVFDGDAESGKITVRLWWGCWKRHNYLTSLNSKEYSTN